MSRAARDAIQAAIDSHNGSKTIYRGKMPRLVKKTATSGRIGDSWQEKAHKVV